MYRLQVKTHFDAAHYLRDYEGKCNREHGHRWEVEVCLQGEKLNHMNMLIDFGKVKAAVNNLIDVYLDHYQINDTLNEANPTAEFLAKWLYDSLYDWFKEMYTKDLAPMIELVRVCVWESPECCVKYSPSMKSVGEAA